MLENFDSGLQWPNQISYMACNSYSRNLYGYYFIPQKAAVADIGGN